MPSRPLSIGVTGYSIHSPLGTNKEEFWLRILNKENCLNQGLGCFPDSQNLVEMSIRSCRAAMTDAGWTHLNSDDGLILATTTGKISEWESCYLDAIKTSNWSHFSESGGVTTPGQSLEELAHALSFRGKSLLVCSACSASTQALALAALWIQSGRVKRCLVGGAETLTTLSTEGFRSLGLLSAEAPMPFDKDRKGINLSEGAAFFCLESVKNQKNIKVYIRGFGMNCDGYHLTSPSPDGSGSQKVIGQALKMAGLEAQDIDWIHAHGTGSSASDKAEATAIQSLFGSQVPVSSTKAYHGHALGASGAIETALVIMAMERGYRVASLGFHNGEPDLKIQIQKDHEKFPLRHVLKNSLGFGGVNAALLLSSQGQSEDLKSDIQSVEFKKSVLCTVDDAKKMLEEAAFRKATVSMASLASGISELLREIPFESAQDKESIGFVVGSSIGEIVPTSEFLKDLALHGKGRPFLFQLSSHNSTAGFLSQHFGLKGPMISLSNGALTGENVLELSWLLLSAGLCKHVIAVASDYGIDDLEKFHFKKKYPAAKLVQRGVVALLTHGGSDASTEIELHSFGQTGNTNVQYSGDFYDSDFLETIHKKAQDGSRGEFALSRYDGTITKFTIKGCNL